MHCYCLAKRGKMMKPYTILIYSSIAAVLFLLSACTLRDELKEGSRPGQAFSSEERWRRSGGRMRSGYFNSGDRRKGEVRSEVTNEEITPARLEYFQGNPHLTK